MAKEVEAEGGELVIKSQEGHFAIIPAKHKAEVLDMLRNGCDGCINKYIQTLPEDSDYAEDGSLLKDEKGTKKDTVPVSVSDPRYLQFQKDSEVDTQLQDKARLNYYNSLLSQSLKAKDPKSFENVTKDVPNTIKLRVEYADEAAKNGYNNSLTTDEMQKILGNDNYSDYNKLRDWYSKLTGVTVTGTGEQNQTTSNSNYGLRNYLMVMPAKFSRTLLQEGDNSPKANYSVIATYNPESDSKYSYEYTNNNNSNLTANK